MTERTTSGGPPQPGPVLEEAAKLAEAARLWLSMRSSRGADDVWSTATAAPAPEQGTPPECTGCPICKARRRLTNVSPETYDQLADAVGALGKVLRDLSSGKSRT